VRVLQSQGYTTSHRLRSILLEDLPKAHGPATTDAEVEVFGKSMVEAYSLNAV